jgi:hypothetical protein
MERIPASERTREHLKALMEGKSPASEASSELVRLAARLRSSSAYLHLRSGSKPTRRQI